MNIGFIGIGQMGKHMSGHILDTEYNFIVCDLNKEAAVYLIDKGAK
jgi:3-hydroxyisobutyrate dehydrogenase-like beta-hydroxyacid dehydrogenase